MDRKEKEDITNSHGAIQYRLWHTSLSVEELPSDMPIKKGKPVRTTTVNVNLTHRMVFGEMVFREIRYRDHPPTESSCNRMLLKKSCAWS
jgi:hypothetical protein